jgi:serine/threonine protein kinase
VCGHCGTGSTGEVYLARLNHQQYLGPSAPEFVAVKVLAPAQGPSVVLLFEHPNVVNYYQILEDEKKRYIVMEHLKGDLHFHTRFECSFSHSFRV